MQPIIGIDQGGSQTRAALSTAEGEILGVGFSHGGYGSWHPEPAMRAIAEAVGRARAVAGLDATPQARVLVAGLTGADWPDEYERLHEQVLALGLAEEVIVTNDSLIALRGGTSQPYGVVVIAGTGANCALRAPSGETFAYHYYLDKELEGGIALARRTLRAVYRAETWREPPTRLTAAVLALLERPSVDALLRADVEGDLDDARVRQIAPLLFAAADEGDSVACRILSDFGEGMAELVTVGLRRFGMDGLPVEVVISGSIFKGRGSLLESVMQAAISRAAPAARLVNARYEPVVGALLLGMEHVSGAVDEAGRAAIETSSQRWGLIRRKALAPDEAEGV